ncbi:MAG: hypothetical protein JXR63_01125, partial [Spirochaetales bacterium]|nr:hypothetical protein [Spirochaetales bacterium]
MKKILALILSIGISVASFANMINYVSNQESESLLINTKHTGAIKDIMSDSKFIFTAGTDGRLKIWDINTLAIVKDIKVTPYSIQKIEIAPETSQILIMISAGSNNNFLTLWDWQSEKMIFQHRLGERPLQFSFSPKNDMIVYSTADMNSLRFLDAKSGNRLYNIQTSLGLISHYMINDVQTVI